MLAKLSALPDVLGKPATLHADQGYFSAENVTACRSAKIAPLIAAGRQPHHPDVATIHDVDGAGFREQQVESVDVVQLAVTCRRRAQRC